MNHETEYYDFYLYNNESYFFSWNNWSLYDGFTFFYYDILAKIALEVMLEKKFKTDTVYAVSLEVYRNPEVPDGWYDYDYDIKEVSHKKALKEVPRIAKEVRNLGSTDCDLMADTMDKLVKLIRSHK